jgi:hypothetical protein
MIQIIDLICCTAQKMPLTVSISEFNGLDIKHLKMARASESPEASNFAGFSSKAASLTPQTLASNLVHARFIFSYFD